MASSSKSTERQIILYIAIVKFLLAATIIVNFLSSWIPTMAVMKIARRGILVLLLFHNFVILIANSCIVNQCASAFDKPKIYVDVPE